MTANCHLLMISVLTDTTDIYKKIQCSDLNKGIKSNLMTLHHSAGDVAAEVKKEIVSRHSY